MSYVASAPVFVSRPRRAFLRLLLADAVRSRWLAFTACTYVVVFGAFIWLGLRESSVLGFTGLSRVILNLANAVALVLPLVSLVATSQTIVRARSGGFFELFLAQPCRRSDWFAAMLASRLIVIAGPLWLLLMAALAVGMLRGESGLVLLTLRSACVSFSLSFAFIGAGLLVSALARTSERATVYALLVWLFASALHDFALIGVLLRVHMPPQLVFGLAALNPVEAARLAMLGSIDPNLAVLGPVGFWISNQLGPKLLVALGIGWPLLLGALCLAGCMRRLDRMDLAG